MKTRDFKTQSIIRKDRRKIRHKSLKHYRLRKLKTLKLNRYRSLPTQPCYTYTKSSLRRLVMGPITSIELNSRCQINLVSIKTSSLLSRIKYQTTYHSLYLQRC